SPRPNTDEEISSLPRVPFAAPINEAAGSPVTDPVAVTASCRVSRLRKRKRKIRKRAEARKCRRAEGLDPNPNGRTRRPARIRGSALQVYVRRGENLASPEQLRTEIVQILSSAAVFNGNDGAGDENRTRNQQLGR